MKTRRDFIRLSAVGAGSLVVGSCVNTDNRSELPLSETDNRKDQSVYKPRIISTWKHGLNANATGWKILSEKGTALDAVEKAANVVELDPTERSVGYGGRPDREGIVTLDACIMDHAYNCGSVAFLQNIKTPVSVARRVMENTPHVMLVGDGALQFALAEGFETADLLVPESKREWKEWLKTSEYKPVVNQENHDTIGILAIDHFGNLAGACTTSGWANKMHGRVGDSPIIGAGLYVDQSVGAACATGLGEMVIKHCGSFLVVELMRLGYSPEEACKEAVKRIVERSPAETDFQIGFLAMDNLGNCGSYAVLPGFNYAIHDKENNEMVDSPYFY